jgi:hypothetical protein
MEGDMHRGDLRERLRFPSAMPKSLAAFALRALTLYRVLSENSIALEAKGFPELT